MDALTPEQEKITKDQLYALFADFYNKSNSAKLILEEYSIIYVDEVLGRSVSNSKLKKTQARILNAIRDEIRSNVEAARGVEDVKGL